MARRIDWDAAFQVYVELGPGRSYRAITEQFHVGQRTVERASKRYRWQERIEEIDAKARAKAEENLVRERSERLTDTLKIIDAARSRFAGQLRMSDFRMTGSDFVGLMKLEALLEGEATDRVELAEVREFVAGLVAGFDAIVVAALDEHLTNGKRAVVLRSIRERVPTLLEQTATKADD